MFHEPRWKRSNQKQMPPEKKINWVAKPCETVAQVKKGEGKKKISFLPIFGINPLSRDIFFTILYSKRDGIKIQRSVKMGEKISETERGKEIESGVQKRRAVPSFRNLSRATALPDHRELLLFFPSLFFTPPR